MSIISLSPIFSKLPSFSVKEGSVKKVVESVDGLNDFIEMVLANIRLYCYVSEGELPEPIVGGLRSFLSFSYASSAPFSFLKDLSEKVLFSIPRKKESGSVEWGALFLKIGMYCETLEYLYDKEVLRFDFIRQEGAKIGGFRLFGRELNKVPELDLLFDCPCLAFYLGWSICQIGSSVKQVLNSEKKFQEVFSLELIDNLLPATNRVALFGFSRFFPGNPCFLILNTLTRNYRMLREICEIEQKRK